MNRIYLCSLAFALTLTCGCGPIQCTKTISTEPAKATAGQRRATPSFEDILAPPSGDGALDKQIASAQVMFRSDGGSATALERLGWLFVAKARESFDDQFYRLAEQCALSLHSRQPGSAAADLLRGHVLHNLHRFKEAEPLARRLAATRGAPFDHGLLGDVLMELGQLDEAASSYQKMLDLRPDSRALARAAYMRWLRGDLSGAVEAMQFAVRAGGMRDGESAAWMNSRLAFYHFASGNTQFAEDACAAALSHQTNYAPALSLLGRVRLAAGETDEATDLLERAARGHLLPEYQWWLTEALMEAGRFSEARVTEADLRRRGAAGDTRTFALFLATRREQTELAVSLMRHELEQRADVFTHDALAWALASAGHLEEARVHMERALSAGTVDARLFFHAAIIAAKSGRADAAELYRTRATSLIHLLLPSERLQLATLATRSAEAGADASAMAIPSHPIVFTAGH